MWLCDCVCEGSWEVLLSLISSETFCLIVYVDGYYVGDGDLSIRLPCTPVLTRSCQIELFNRSKNNCPNVRWLESDSISRRTKLYSLLVLKIFLLGCTLEDMFQILVCSKLLIPPECVCHACQRVNDHHVLCILAQSHPALVECWEPVKSKRFLFWCWHKNREIFTRTNYMMTFECGRGVNDQMCKQNSKRHDRHTFRTLCTPRKNVTKGKTSTQYEK